MGGFYALPEAYAQALYSLISEALEVDGRGKRPGENTEIAFRIELHLQKIYTDALAVKSLSHEKCADMLLDLIRYSNPEIFSTRQWQGIYLVIELWLSKGRNLTHEHVSDFKKALELVGFEIHSRESHIQAMREQATKD